MRKLIEGLFLVSLVLSLNCTIETVHKNPEFEDFIYPVIDGSWWIHTLSNPETAKTLYDDTNIKFILHGTYEHPTSGTVTNLEYYRFDPVQQDWLLKQTLYVKVRSDSVCLYFNDSESYNLLLRISAEVGDEWPVNPHVTARAAGRVNMFAGPVYFENCLKIQYSDSLSSGILWIPSNVGGLGVRMSTIALRLAADITDVIDYEEAVLYKMGSDEP
jgi:hypothetical protein